MPKPPETPKHPGGVSLYHVVYAHEDFETAADMLFTLVRHAQQETPGKPRYLYLDIEGHRNSAGGFDRDMMELQKEFVLGFLLPWLTQAHVPLIGVQNGQPQRNDVPETIDTQPPAEEGGSPPSQP